MIPTRHRAWRGPARIVGGLETGANAWPRTAAAVIDGRTAPRLAWAIAGAWDAQPEPCGEPEPATHANARDSRTARAVAAAAAVLAVAAALAIPTRATESGDQSAQPGRGRGWFRGAPALAAPTSGPADGRNPGRGERDMRSLVTAGATLAIGAAGQAGAGEPVQWRVEDGGNGHWYELAALPGKGTTRIPWGEAKSRAEAVGGHLATLTSTGEAAFIWTNFNSQMVDNVWGSPWCCWLGGYRVSGQTFAWVTSEPYSCTVLCGSPCEGGGENALYTGQTDGPLPCVDFHYSNFQGGKPYYLVEFSRDCDGNGIVDFGEIRAGQLPDQNANNVPDGCECAAHPDLDACCPGDLYPNGVVNGADLAILLSEWGEVTPTTTADLNRNGAVDGSDLGILLGNWGSCPD